MTVEQGGARPRAGGDPARLAERVGRALTMSGTRISFLCESDGTVAWVSDSIEPLLGHRPADLVGTRFQDLYSPDDRVYSEQGFATIRANPTVNPKVFMFLPRTAQVRHADGRYVTVESHPTPILHDPDVDAVLMEWHLVADRRLLLGAIDAVANNRPLPETITAVSELFESLLPGMHLEVVEHTDGWRPAGTPRRRDVTPLLPHLAALDELRWIETWLPLDDQPWAVDWAGPGNEVALVPLLGRDGVLHGAAVMVGDVLQGVGLMIRTVKENLLSVALRMLVLSLAHEHSQAELRRAAEQDRLTGLLNRVGLDRVVDALAEGPVQKATVLLVDLDDFKPVNDTYGHAVGDELLQGVAWRLQQCLRTGDVAARIGGDEFVVLCPGLDDGDRVGRRVLDAMTRSLPLSEGEVTVGVSVGSATGTTGELRSLFPRADGALYQAKRAGKNGYRSA